MQVKEQTDDSRILWLDTFKALAIISIFVGHFIATYHKDWLVYETFLFTQFLDAKMGAAILSVLVGFFAYKTGERRKRVFLNSLNRYFYFFLAALMINSLIVALNIPKNGISARAVLQVISDSFLLNDLIYPTFWCIRYFFAASVLSYINGAYRSDARTVIIELIAMYIALADVWVLVCVLGNIVYIVIRNFEDLKYKWLLYIATILLYVTLPAEESKWKFMQMGLVAMFGILSVNYCKPVKKLMSFKPLAYIGSISMSIFLTHVVIQKRIGGWLFDKIVIEPYYINFLIVFVICLVITVVFSALINKPLITLSKNLTGLADKIIHKIKK